MSGKNFIPLLSKFWTGKKDNMDNYNSTFKKLGIGENFFNLTFSDFHNYKVSKLCQNYVANFDKFSSTGSGLIFSGVPGSGKTMLGSLILMELVKKRNIVGSCLDLEQVIYLISNQWKDEDQKEKINRKLFLAPILMLDNIPYTLTKSRDINEILYLILSRRLKINKPTLLTTSLSEDKLKTSLSKEVRSILTECTYTVALPDIDYRAKLSKHKDMQKFLMEGI